MLKENMLTEFSDYVVYADKRANSVGLQIADLVAHPIGRNYINPNQKNRSYEILAKKFYKYPNHGGKGIKIFPKGEKAKSPEKPEAYDAG
jgi:hypothetical protein